jgi:light-regulated signal transduction histidine kinase (bacteriophytochrome)
LEKRVKDRTFQMENAFKEMEEFAFSVAHDLHAPLRAIDGFSKMLLQEFRNLDPEITRIHNVISQSSNKMRQLIDSLLLFSCVGKEVVVIDSINMSDIVQSVIKQINTANWQNSPVIDIKELYGASGDRTMLLQVWTNLINNAFKFSSKTQNPEIEIGSYKNEKEIVFYIKDNGVGFNPEYMDKLFKVFHRLHKSEDYEGTGIGLAIVRKAISRHRGRVWAESIEEKGACFYFALPLVIDVHNNIYTNTQIFA